MGYKEAEAVYATLGAIGPALKDSGLKPVSVHVDTALFMEGGSKLDDAFGQVKQFGFEYVVLALHSSGAARRHGHFQKAGRRR